MTAVLATRVGDYIVRAHNSKFATITKAADAFDGSHTVAIVNLHAKFVTERLRKGDVEKRLRKGDESPLVYGAAFAPDRSVLDIAMIVAGAMCHEDEIDRAMRDGVTRTYTPLIGRLRGEYTLAGVTWYSVYPARYEYAGHPIV